MAKRDTFLSETIAVLEELGGQAHFSDIYKKILIRGKLDFSNAKTPDATLRRTLQVNRLEHPKSESNTFYSIYGVNARKGYWGLIKQIEKELYSPDDIPIDVIVTEGAKKTITVNSYERNLSARISCIEHFGADCAVCGFNFGKTYGKKFIGKIHIHHVVPIASIGEEYQLDPQKDLIPLCPNCHYVAHLKGTKETYTIEELKEMIKKSNHAQNTITNDNNSNHN